MTHAPRTPDASRFDADVIVVGLGAWGSQALWRLAARGVRVIGIEQFDVAHDLGSAHGATRLFRIACMEHPALATIALRARDLWRELEAASGAVLLRQTGGLMVGPPRGHIVQGSVAAARHAGLETEQYDRDEVVERFPAYAGLGPDDVGVWDPHAGLNYPERAVAAAVATAERLGATVLTRTAVHGVTTDADGVTVETPSGTFRARRVVIAAGAWMPDFTDAPLAPRRTPMFWFRGEGGSTSTAFGLDRFPVFMRQLATGTTLWGHGADTATEAGQHGIKIGIEDDGVTFQDTAADELDRVVDLDADTTVLRPAVDFAFRGIDPRPVKAVPCMFTNSIDRQFLLGPTRDSDRVVVAGGDSGHGFKHAPAIGELLAQFAVGERPFTEVDFMRPDRTYDGTSWADDIFSSQSA